MRAIRVSTVLKAVFLTSGLVVASSSLASCTDAEVLPPQATLAMSLAHDPASPGSCSLNQTIEYIPNDDQAASRLSASTIPEQAATMPRAKNGSDDAKIRCKVSGDGVYETSISIKQGNLSFTYNGSIPGTGPGRSFSQSNLTELHTDTCTVSPDETYEGGGGIRATFSCPGAIVDDQPGVRCSINGSFIVERCDK